MNLTYVLINLQKRNVSPSPSKPSKSSKLPGQAKPSPSSGRKSGRTLAPEITGKRSRREVHKPTRFLDFI